MFSSVDALIEQLGLDEARDSMAGRVLRKTWPILDAQVRKRVLTHGSIEDWRKTLHSLPAVHESHARFNSPSPQVYLKEGEASAGVAIEKIKEVLHGLGPWRKGPFDILGVKIDSEWRSEKKWQRVLDLASPLEGRRVLDVGTGNGYYLYRAHGEGARFVLGLEPSMHYVVQYLALQRYFRCSRVAILPLTSSEFTQECGAFDTVMSMGVLYHRRSPLDHLQELRGFLKTGGELLLETIVVDGPLGHSLMPQARYAQMRNVWFLPSTKTLVSWLKRVGFLHIKVGSQVKTTGAEQRSTAWAPGESLAEYLDPHDPSLTVEGYPAPQRVLIRATAPPKY